MWLRLGNFGLVAVWFSIAHYPNTANIVRTTLRVSNNQTVALLQFPGKCAVEAFPQITDVCKRWEAENFGTELGKLSVRQKPSAWMIRNQLIK